MSLPFETYAASGLSVLPVRKDKRPAIGAWGQFQKTPATAQEIASWGNPEGIALIGGQVSGGLVCLDFDEKYDPQKTVFKDWCALVEEWGGLEILQKVVIQGTPSGGYHAIFRSPIPYGCEKLARAQGKTEAMIETKGEGGYFLCAPTEGYTVANGSIEEIPVLTEKEATTLLSACLAQNRDEPPKSEAVENVKHEGKPPFDDYNDRAPADEILGILEGSGWRRVGQKGQNVHLCRPEKGGKQTSATFHLSQRVFFVFTSSSNFHPGKGYGPVSVYATLKHGGDLKAAARALLAEGYGEKREQKPTAPKVETGVKVSARSTLAEEVLALYHKPFYPGESTGWKELDKLFKIEKGQMNILFGIPSHGKSSFMDALMANVIFPNKWNALIFSPENKSAAYHASKLCEILVGKPMYGDGKMTEQELAKAAERVAERFTFLSQSEGGTGLDDILAQVKDRKPDFVVVDPWNRIDHTRTGGMTETEYIGSCLAKTSAMAKALDLSFWYVVHPQKLRRDKNGDIIRPGFYEVSGSAHWANMADNGILVYRDFANQVTEIETVKVRYRHNGNAGTVKMKFDRSCGRFKDMNAGDEFLHGTDYKSRAAGDDTPGIF